MYYKHSQKKSFLGEGAFGLVFKMLKRSHENKPNPTYYAAKHMDNVEEDVFAAEYKIMKFVKHPNIVQVIEAVKISNTSYILLLEFCKHKSLQDLINFKHHLSEDNLMYVFY